MSESEGLSSRRQELRRQMLCTRGELDAVQVETLSDRIIERLEVLEPLRLARTIMGFVSVNNEVNLCPLLERMRAGGRTIVLPRVAQNGQLEAVEFQGWEQTREGSFGIKEPLGEAFDPLAIDAVLVPGLVFDVQGYRLGYGKGYYDRFLPRLRPGAFRCGVAYEFQIVDEVYPHQADVGVHWIVSERSEIAVDWDYF